VGLTKATALKRAKVRANMDFDTLKVQSQEATEGMVNGETGFKDAFIKPCDRLIGIPQLQVHKARVLFLSTTTILHGEF